MSTSEATNGIEAILLEKAIGDLVIYGQRIGMKPQEMISLLDSGISVVDLLGFLGSKRTGTA